MTLTRAEQWEAANRIPNRYKLLILREGAIAKGNRWVWLNTPSWR